MADQEMSEDLDYDITFPSPVSQDISDEDFVDLGDGEQKEPVVILLGWMGCQEKHLEKYSAIYEQRRCITIRYTAPTDKVFYKPESLKPIAGKILELIFDMSLEDNPIFFHVFSNGGGYVYSYITEILTSDQQFSNLRIRGCVMDSVPSKRRLLVAAKALIASMKIPMFLRYIFAFFWMIYIVIQKFLKNLGFQSTNTLSAYDTYFDKMKNNRCPWPQLFLYSKGDKVVMYQDVDEVIAARKKQGISVHVKCWDDSPHVAHFKHHRMEYIEECYTFLDHCLKID